MGKILEELSSAEEAFISQQKLFFVATAPISKDHHVNVSPKAPGSSLIVLDSRTVAYCDLSGSGAETAAHLLENGRITLLFCNIESGPPKLLRIHGTGTVIPKEEAKPSLLAKFDSKQTSHAGFRAIYVIKAQRISTSCGYSMPIMKFEKFRTVLDEWTEKKGNQGMEDYRLQKNSFSIDGLPSLTIASKKCLSDSSSKIVPVEQEGYIYGRLVEKDDNDPDTESFDYSRLISRSRKSKGDQGLLVTMGMVGVAFAVGFVFGNAVQKRY
jgi:hypothetical protein